MSSQEHVPERLALGQPIICEFSILKQIKSVYIIVKLNFNLPLDKYVYIFKKKRKGRKEIIYSNIKALQEKKILLVQGKSNNYAHKKHIQNSTCSCRFSLIPKLPKSAMS